MEMRSEISKSYARTLSLLHTMYSSGQHCLWLCPRPLPWSITIVEGDGEDMMWYPKEFSNVNRPGLLGQAQPVIKTSFPGTSGACSLLPRDQLAKNQARTQHCLYAVEEQPTLSFTLVMSSNSNNYRGKKRNNHSSIRLICILLWQPSPRIVQSRVKFNTFTENPVLYKTLKNYSPRNRISSKWLEWGLVQEKCYVSHDPTELSQTQITSRSLTTAH